jgi:hypothetical protein
MRCLRSPAMSGFDISSDPSEYSASVDAPSALSSTCSAWSAAEILAERGSLSGEVQLLVVWKPEWVPVSAVHDGCVRDAWLNARMWTAHQSSGDKQIHVSLPIEPHSAFARDVAIMEASDASDRVLADRRASLSQEGTRKPTLASDSAAPLASDSSDSEEFLDSASSSYTFGVSHILAQRGTLTGEDEVLVIWTPEWVSSGVVRDGSARDAWSSAQKWTAVKSSGDKEIFVSLPIEPETPFARSVAIMAASDRGSAAAAMKRKR